LKCVCGNRCHASSLLKAALTSCLVGGKQLVRVCAQSGTTYDRAIWAFLGVGAVTAVSWSNASDDAGHQVAQLVQVVCLACDIAGSNLLSCARHWARDLAITGGLGNTEEVGLVGGIWALDSVGTTWAFTSHGQTNRAVALQCAIGKVIVDVAAVLLALLARAGNSLLVRISASVLPRANIRIGSARASGVDAGAGGFLLDFVALLVVVDHRAELLRSIALRSARSGKGCTDLSTVDRAHAGLLSAAAGLVVSGASFFRLAERTRDYSHGVVVIDLRAADLVVVAHGWAIGSVPDAGQVCVAIVAGVALL